MNFRDWAGIVGDTASAIGLLITFVVWLHVRSIRRGFTSKARLPELLTELRNTSGKLLSSLQDVETLSQESSRELARLAALLDSIRDKVGQPQRGTVIKVLKMSRGHNDGWRIWRLQRDRRSPRDRAWDVYNETEGLIESLKQAVKDSKWS